MHDSRRLAVRGSCAVEAQRGVSWQSVHWSELLSQNGSTSPLRPLSSFMLVNACMSPPVRSRHVLCAFDLLQAPSHSQSTTRPLMQRTPVVGCGCRADETHSMPKQTISQRDSRVFTTCQAWVAMPATDGLDAWRAPRLRNHLPRATLKPPTSTWG